MSLLDLGPVLFGDIDTLLAWFQCRHLLSRQMACPTCGTAMDFQERNDIQDKRRSKYSYTSKNSNILQAQTNRWRCPVTTCRKSVSVREGSFFSQSRLSLQQWLLVIHWWCRQYPVTDAAEEAKMSKRTAIQCYQYLRDICSWRLVNRDAPILLGGPGQIVQIDESLFRHKPKVYMFLSYTM